MTTAKSTDEWFTPKEIIDALGDFDLDPCAPLEPLWQKDLSQWANRKWFFTSCEFKDYEPRKGFKCKTYFENNLKD